MKTHTSAFKNAIKEYGREIDSIITYTIRDDYSGQGIEIELGQEELNSISSSYEGSILKSVMKQLIVDSNESIPVDTIINLRFGVKVRDDSLNPSIDNDYRKNYDYVNFGNYIVKEVTKKEDTNSYEIKCYDKMLYSMQDYERMTDYKLSSDTTFIETKIYYKLGYYVKSDDTTYLENVNYYVLVNEEYVLLVPGEDYNVGDDITDIVYEYENEYIEYEGDRTGNPSELGLYELYPITIRDYINYIATKLGLTFKNVNDTFPNYDKEINQELFFSREVEEIEEESESEEEPEESAEEPEEQEVTEDSEESEEETSEEESEPAEESEPTAEETTPTIIRRVTYSSLGYTYRDILDQLAQVTASTICINEEDDELELRYINDTEDIIDEEYLKDSNVNFGEKYGPINSIVLSRSAESDNVYLQDEESVDLNGLHELKIIDNQFMNFNDRSQYLPAILEELDGLEYYTNDLSSTGIVYYNLCDKYYVSRNNITYDCLMLNDEVLISQGLEENIHTDYPEDSETDYDKADKTDLKINKAILMVNKQDNRIEALVQSVETQGDGLNSLTNRVETNITSTEASINAIQNKLTNGVETLRNQLITIDALNGITVSTDQDVIKTIMNNYEFSIRNGETKLAYFGYDNDLGSTKAEMDNLTVRTYFVTGVHRFETFTTPDTQEERTGVFYIGE